MSVETSQGKRLTNKEKIALMKERFEGRTDLFYQKRTWIEQEFDADISAMKPVQKKNFYLVCGKYGDADLCWIKQGKSKTCGACPNRANKIVDDSVYSTHIFGSTAMCIVPATEKGVKVAALDFDKSTRGTGIAGVFADAKMVRDWFNKLGLFAHLARSSDKGYHIYLFFDSWVPTYKITSIFAHINKVSGLTDLVAEGNGSLPEQFPKQEYNKSNPGSSLRIPMSEQDMRNGKNCFVDDDSTPYHLEKQWDILTNITINRSADIDDIMATNKIETIDPGSTAVYKKKSVPLKDGNGIVQKDNSGNIIMTDENIAIKKEGSFWNVVAGCRALQELWAKDEDGRFIWDYARERGIRHTTRLHMMNLAISTTDGEEILRKRWEGEDETMRSLQATIDHNYGPAKCSSLQACGACRVGIHPKFAANPGEPTTFCLEQRPPREVVNGVLVVKEDVPKEDWPEPSPIRFRYGAGRDVETIKTRLKYLYSIVKQQDRLDKGKDFSVGDPKADKDPIFHNQDKIIGSIPADMATQLIEDILAEVMQMKKAESSSIANFVYAEGIMTKAEWKEKTKTASTNSHGTKVTEVKERSFTHKGRTYTLREGNIVSMYIDAKGVAREELVADFWIERTSEPAKIRLIEGDGEKKDRVYEDRNYALTIHYKKESYNLTIPNQIFSSPSSFFVALRAAGGTNLNFSTSKDAYDVLINSIKHFSNVVEDKAILEFMGYWQLDGSSPKYIVPNKIVSAAAIDPNSNYELDYKDDYTKSIGFKQLSPTELKDLCQHIVKDFFNCNNPALTMSCFGHAMGAVCTYPIEVATSWKKAPILWVAGSFGQGKSFVVENTQFFFGDFSMASANNTDGSGKAKIGLANFYRHALLCFDDQKDIDRKDQGQSIVKWVNHTYDRSSYAALNRDSTLREKPAKNQGLVIINGEDFPDKDASSVSRLIIVDVPMYQNREEGGRVLRNRKNYCGFTPMVIQYLLKMTTADMQMLWERTVAEFVGDITEDTAKYSINRIGENLSLNFIGFWAAMQVMYECGGISIDERNKYIEQHKNQLMEFKASQVKSVQDARGSAVFLSSLRELLSDPNRWIIHGWNGHRADQSRANIIGFYSPKTPEVVFVYSDLAYQAVSDAAKRKNTIMQKWPHIVRQLIEDKVFDEDLADRSDGKWTCRRKGPTTGVYSRVYPFKAKHLGIFGLNHEVEGAENARDSDKNAM